MDGDRRGWRQCLPSGAVLAVCMAGTTLPTPLYGLYQEKFGFSELTVTVVYAVYAFGVIGVLLAGNASDAVGRRPVLLSGLGLAAGSDRAVREVGRSVSELLLLPPLQRRRRRALRSKTPTY